LKKKEGNIGNGQESSNEFNATATLRESSIDTLAFLG